jgi:hypothetical protein
VCGALSDGRERDPRQGDHCECPDGWEGINCNGMGAFDLPLSDQLKELLLTTVLGSVYDR